MLKKFWIWYERNYRLNITIAAGLFVLQLVHLYWLTTHVVWLRLFGSSIFNPSRVWEGLILLVDYTEIPAIISTSLVYLYKLRQKFRFKEMLYLFFLNIQFIHIFWITDEFVVSRFTQDNHWPLWLAGIAILIDYLELPVIWDTMKLFVKEVSKGNVKKAFEVVKD